MSIVGAVRLADQGAQGGVGDLLWILVSIIVAVGIINLVPMLPLDGGHVLVAVYERIRSRRGTCPRPSTRARRSRACLSVESRVSPAVIEDLRRRGHLVNVRPAWSLGRVSAVARRSGVLYAAANPRGMQGYAVGR